MAAEQAAIQAIGFDTWGVDFGLLDRDGQLIEAPRCYRDERGERGGVLLDQAMPSADRYHRSGIAQWSFNSLNQLSALVHEQPDLAEQVAHIAFLPNLLAYRYSGVLKTERTIAATSSCYTAGCRELDHDLLQQMQIPASWFPELVATGHHLGPVTSELAERLGLPGDCQVFASAGHDTSSAVGAIDRLDGDYAYLSSGTWSLIGAVIDDPIADAAALAMGASNEAHIDQRQRFNVNVMGLWILQQCRQAWLADDAVSDTMVDYAQLAMQAAGEPAYRQPALAVNDQRFLAPHSADNSMPQRVQSWFSEHGLRGDQLPQSPSQLARAILDGLAQAYGTAMTDLRRLTGDPLTHLTIVGGGNKNALLNDLTAEATGCHIICGHNEATAWGNASIIQRAWEKL